MVCCTTRVCSWTTVGRCHGLIRAGQLMQQRERTRQMRAVEVVIHGVPVAGQEIVAVHVVDVAVAVVVDAVPGYLPRGSTSSRAVTCAQLGTDLQGAWRGCARRPSRTATVAGFARRPRLPHCSGRSAARHLC